MYHHIKKLMYTVRVDEPDPRFGNMLLEQFGGANGELAAAMQYSIQGLNCEGSGSKRSPDGYRDRGVEPSGNCRNAGPYALETYKIWPRCGRSRSLGWIAGGGGVNLFNSQGNAWTADYLKITGELDVDLRSNIAAEARAKIVYERLINFCDDAGTKDALQFLMTREITHMRAFTLALESMGKLRFSIGQIPPTPGLVNQYFNDSTGQGEDGELDARGPWNQGDDWQFVESPVVKQAANGDSREEIVAVHSQPADNEILRELLVEELQDMLSAENQIVKTLPKLIKSAESPSLKAAFEVHLEETKSQVDRLKEAFGILGVQAKAKLCKGMAGLLQEGEEMIAESKDKDSAARDLVLITAAQKVEHYEISAYGSARVLAQQLGQPDVAQLLSKTLAEEQNADSVLTDCARPLISEVTLVS